MGSSRTSSWSTGVWIGLLALLLPGLAILQYRWMGTLSAAEQRRMHSSLERSVALLSSELSDALEPAHDVFLTDLTERPAAAPLADALAASYRRWQHTAPHPDLLPTLYWAERTPDGSVRLFRLDAAARQLRPAAWPRSLHPWRSYLAASDSAHTPAPPTTAPVLALPILPPPGTPAPSVPSTPNYVLLPLDAAYLTDAFLPDLVRSYQLDAAAGYDVLIHRRDRPDEILFATDTTLRAEDLAPPDAAADLGLFQQLHVFVERGADDDVSVLVTKETTHAQPPNEQPSTAALPVETDRPARTMRTSTVGPVAPWRLLAQHRAGSVEAAVSRMRRRNLGLSFGILLVLGAAAGLLAVSVRQARRLADQQMAFVAGISHELRTPLAVIQSAAENLADGVIREPEQARRYGTLLRHEGRRLSDMVEHVLALAATQSGRRAYDFQPISVAELVEDVVDRVRAQPETSDAPIPCTIAPDLPPVQADRPALETALRNLLRNAIKHGDGRPEIDVRCENGNIQIAVRDHGPGIPAEELPHLFEPFFRGQRARQDQTAGSGVGLSLVRHTMDAHGGRVTVESRPGAGAIFTLHLPLPDADDA